MSRAILDVPFRVPLDRGGLGREQSNSRDEPGPGTELSVVRSPPRFACPLIAVFR